MMALRQLGFLKVNFRREETAEDDHRVLALFRNRAELKKAYGELQEEIYRLKDRIKQQEGATQRVQEMLGALEGRLGLSETAFPALVFYQLRRLWQTGRELLERFVTELAAQQDERERRQHLAEHNRRVFAKRQAADQRLRGAQRLVAEEAARLTDLESQRARLQRFWHYFKRRALEQTISQARAAAAAADLSLVAAREAVEEIEREPVPEFPGLSLEARRAINIAAIAYAEVLCLRLARTQLVMQAREATRHREATDEYGSRAECEALMKQIERAAELLRAPTNLTQEVKQRSGRLTQLARYRVATDAAPTAESLAFSEGDALGAEPGGLSAARMPNVLAEDTWDVYGVLLR
ncbi:MAG TPA: hypothetical protein VFW10_05165 [Steroidobacteraceae bacterium]|jgi:hypothetical protein|nr:hypothetical protein [Steroidobacteraceae bacterium]